MQVMVCFVDVELFDRLRAWLTRQHLLQFTVELLFFLNGEILLDHLLCLANESLLKRLDFPNEFVRCWIAPFEFSPAVDV